MQGGTLSMEDYSKVFSQGFESLFYHRSAIHPVQTFTYMRRWYSLKPLVPNERCFKPGIVIGGCQGCLTAVIPLFIQTLWPLRWRVTAAVEEQMLKGQYKVQGLRWDNKSLSFPGSHSCSPCLCPHPPPRFLSCCPSHTHTYCFSLWTLVFLCLLFRHTAHHLGHSTRSRSLLFFFCCFFGFTEIILFFTWLLVTAMLSGNRSLLGQNPTQYSYRLK